MKDLILSAEILRLADPWVLEEPEPSKLVMARIRVEPHPKGGAIIVACCGGAIFVAYDRTAQCKGTYTLDLPDVIYDNLCGSTTISARKVWFTDKKISVIQSGDEIVSVPLLDERHRNDFVLPNGSYVNWRYALPDKADFGVGRHRVPEILSADYLHRIGLMYEADEWSEHRSVHFVPGKALEDKRRGVHQTVFLFFPWRPSMFVLLAPFLDESMDRQYTYPEWLDKDPSAGL